MTDETDDPHASGNSQPRERTIRLPVPRMDCRWKARRVADYLRGVEGVIETSHQPRSGTVFVTYDPGLTSEEAITAAVESPGSAEGRNSTRTGHGRRSGGCCCRDNHRTM